MGDRVSPWPRQVPGGEGTGMCPLKERLRGNYWAARRCVSDTVCGCAFVCTYTNVLGSVTLIGLSANVSALGTD